jgi:hypothetical protein
MRIYIIANDGITLWPEIPTAMTEGEIAVASKEELHAAPLSGKRLLALWNALPSVEKRRKVGERAALIDQLWTAIEALPEPEPQKHWACSRADIEARRQAEKYRRRRIRAPMIGYPRPSNLYLQARTFLQITVIAVNEPLPFAADMQD